ncbi:MAG: radical SAM protein [Clostridia bacterium]|nr:radical SAM protein [Clostridia bacterium]
MINNITLKTFVHGENCYLYCPFPNKLIRISKEHYSEIKFLERYGLDCYLKLEKESQAYKDIVVLIQKKVIVESPIKRIEHPLTNYVEPLLDRGLNFLILQVTKDCNFSCRYCLFASKSSDNLKLNHQSNYMSFDTARRSVDFLYNHSQDAKELMISFYGGEPLLNFDLIRQTVEYAKKIFVSKKFKFGMTTNASLLNETMINFFIEHNFYLTISLDGDPQTQNCHRKFYANGYDTFDIVWNNVQTIRKINNDYFISHVVFHPVIFVDEDNDKVMGFFQSNGISNDMVSIQYANTQGIDYTFNGVFRENIEKKSIPISDFKKMEETLKSNLPILVNWHHSGPCVPGALRLYVDIAGNFFPCEKTCSLVSIGNLDQGFCIQNVKDMLNIGKLTSDNCKHCWAVRFCSLCVSQCVDLGTNKIDKGVKTWNCSKQKDNVIKFFKEYIDKTMDYSL